MKKISEYFARIDLIRNGRLFGFGTGPEADWKIISFGTLIMTLVMIVMGGYVFIKVDKGEVFVTKGSADSVERTLNVSLLQDVVVYYKNKEVKFEEIINSRVDGVDPSI